MTKVKKASIYSLIIAVLITVDLITKSIAQANLMGSPTIKLLGGFIKLIYAENTGGMLSFGSEVPEIIRIIVFQVLVSGLLLFLFGYIIYKNDLTKIQLTSFILFLGGGFGNLIDRFLNDGKVIDFMVLELFGLHTGIFNVADMYVTTGVGLILLASILEKLTERKRNIENKTADIENNKNEKIIE